MTVSLSLRFRKNSRARVIARALSELLQEKDASEHAALIDAALHSLKEQKLHLAIPFLPGLVSEEWKRKEKGISAVVTSARKLPEKTKHALTQGLSKALGKNIDLQEHTNAVLLGGFSLALDDERLDGSLRGALDSLRTHLLHA